MMTRLPSTRSGRWTSCTTSWPMDAASGLFNVIDDFNREALGIEIDFSLPSERVIRALRQIINWRGRPRAIRCDNGPEYLSAAITEWARQYDIRLDYIQPGKPQQNAYVERLDRAVRMAVAVPLGGPGPRAAFRDRLDVDLQSRPPEHGLGRIYAKTAAGHGRVVSTSEPRGKRGDYPRSAVKFPRLRSALCDLPSATRYPPCER